MFYVKDWVERRERVTASEHNTTIAGQCSNDYRSGSHFAIAGPPIGTVNCDPCGKGRKEKRMKWSRRGQRIDGRRKRGRRRKGQISREGEHEANYKPHGKNPARTPWLHPCLVHPSSTLSLLASDKVTPY